MSAASLFGPLCVRADAGPTMGVGHLMRCLALAQAWQDRGGAVIFVTATRKPALLSRVIREGFAVHELKALPGTDADACETLAVAAKAAAGRAGAVWLVVDGYQFPTDYFRALKAGDIGLLAVDDLATIDLHAADLVLNQNMHATAGMYAGRAASGHLLLGSSFALLRREFRLARKSAPGAMAGPPRDGDVRDVVITLGGGDQANVTGGVLKILAGFRDRRLRLTIIVGPANPHLVALRDSAAQLQPAHDVTLLADPPDLPALLTSADVAISAAGSSCWELACLGVPMLLIVTADNQRPSAAALAADDVAIVLGWHAGLLATDLLPPLRTLLMDREARRRLSRTASQLIDGRGAGRVAERVATFPVRLRTATAADAVLLHGWANDPLTRRMSFSTEPIHWDTHLPWLTGQLVNPDCRLYIGEDDGGEALGQVRLDRAATTATLSVGLAPSARGRGYAARLVRLAAIECLQNGWCRIVEARVRPENAASLATFRRAGFTDRGPTADSGSVLFRLT
jgi:UDP-2,4-diacetamido-2,4,6-trideoxy-beta-L-altropyranose hydrolase